MWRALGGYFRDKRLLQLFGRYATYCGSSPFLAPATLMLVAHVEQSGVWLVDGGMHRLAAGLAALAARHGAVFRYGAEAAEILSAGGRAAGVRLATGERFDADAVVLNADLGALENGGFGREAARAAPGGPSAERSLSAVTWALLAPTEGFPLARHNVFFSGDYAGEFDDIFERRMLPAAPTIYVCAQDRDDRNGAAPLGPERLLCLVNAPANGDSHSFDALEVKRCEQRTFAALERCGLRIHHRQDRSAVTTPADFARLFPGSGGALYGRACHGWKASFERPGSQSRMSGLYLTGGGVHPGPGVPMAALSGLQAAHSVMANSTSTVRSRRTAMAGGTSMR
jgi:1-hydroxycarotenoid 3,4-desaturase